MKITNRQIVNIINAVVSLQNKKLPIKISFAIKKNLTLFEDAINACNATRQELLDQYADKDAKGDLVVLDGARYSFSEENFAPYNEAYNELMDIENDIELHAISEKDIEKLEDDRYDTLTYAEVDALSLMIK